MWDKDNEKPMGTKRIFRKPILDILENDHVEAIIPVSETVYRVDESRYKYNKDKRPMVL